MKSFLPVDRQGVQSKFRSYHDERKKKVREETWFYRHEERVFSFMREPVDVTFETSFDHVSCNVMLASVGTTDC